MILILRPFHGIGPFDFNEPIAKYESPFFLVKDTNEGDKYDVYSLEYPAADLYVQDGIIESINCYEECIYKGRNIIGMTIDEFIKFYEILPIEDIDELDFEEDNIPQYVYEFDQIGLQVWVKRGKILNVIASGVDDEE